MRYWLKRMRVCVRWWARNFKYEKFTSADGINALKIFIFVTFGFLLGWHTTNLQVRQCEAEMDKRIQTDHEAIARVTEEHTQQLNQQREQYQKLLGEELRCIKEDLQIAKQVGQEMVKKQTELANELDEHN